MKTGTLLLFGGIAAGLYYVTKLAGAAGRLTFVLQGIIPKSVTDWQVTLMVQNVSNGDLILNALSGNISINGNYVGNISDFSGAVTVPGASQQPVNIDLQPSLLALPGAIADLIKNPQGDIDIRIDGNANVNGIVYPFTLDKTFNFSAN